MSYHEYSSVQVLSRLNHSTPYILLMALCRTLNYWLSQNQVFFLLYRLPHLPRSHFIMMSEGLFRKFEQFLPSDGQSGLDAVAPRAHENPSEVNLDSWVSITGVAIHHLGLWKSFNSFNSCETVHVSRAMYDLKRLVESGLNFT